MVKNTVQTFMANVNMVAKVIEDVPDMTVAEAKEK